jgi:hypothetical protein
MGVLAFGSFFVSVNNEPTLVSPKAPKILGFPGDDVDSIPVDGTFEVLPAVVVVFSPSAFVSSFRIFTLFISVSNLLIRSSSAPVIVGSLFSRYNILKGLSRQVWCGGKSADMEGPLDGGTGFK